MEQQVARVLTPFQRRKLTRRFYVFDSHRRGVMRWEDMARVLENVLELSGWAFDAQERQRFLLQGRTGWQLLVASADANFDGEVSLEEWLGFYETVIVGSAHSPEQLPPWLDALCTLSFDAMDENGDGYISREEYRAMMKAWGVEGEDVEGCFDKIDRNGDGVLSRIEWRELNIDFYWGNDPKAASTWLWGDIYKTLLR